jgi:hypothetical protein
MCTLISPESYVRSTSVDFATLPLNHAAVKLVAAAASNGLQEKMLT